MEQLVQMMNLMEIIQYLNTCMEKYDAHIVDLDVCADLERPEEK